MEEVKKSNKIYNVIEKIIELIVLLSFVVLTYYVGSHHEHWADEAQAWLLARDLNPLELFRQMKYEGHPFLWNLILMPFAKLGFPYIIQSTSCSHSSISYTRLNCIF